MEVNQVFHADCFDILKDLPNNSIDAVITDPPYGYLKHKLDCPFDYQIFFELCYQKLAKDSMLVFFGRGEMLARWIITASDLGFIFKEEIVWDKLRLSSPMTTLLRVHELISVFSKGKATMNKVHVNKIEYDLLCNTQTIVNDLKRIVSTIKTITTWEQFKKDFIELDWRGARTDKHSITIKKNTTKQRDAGVNTFISHTKGKVLSSIVRVPKEHYQYQHPTQKPVELMKQLIRLTTKEGDTVLDPFGGSGTTAIACLELNRNYIIIEKDLEYYNIINDRILDWQNKPKQQELDI
jgi:site-specific DNA-methyltransferase (adenine-specific)